MEKDNLWFITRWLEGVSLSSDSDPDRRKRKKVDDAPTVFSEKDSEGE